MAFHVPVALPVNPSNRQATDSAELNAWLVINTDNTVVIRVPQAEMGQGVSTSLPMIVADELEVDFDQVRVEYANPRRVADYGAMNTGGSRAVRRFRPMLQQAGAEA